MGFLYFYGEAVELNQTKAFQYFLRAAQSGTDADSLFNAGYCLEQGIGVEKNPAEAAALYLIGARQFGSFDCIRSLAMMRMEGRGLSRSAPEALQFLKATVTIGPWGAWLRRGLDAFLSGHYYR